jgi:hypothetical protein
VVLHEEGDRPALTRHASAAATLTEDRAGAVNSEHSAVDRDGNGGLRDPGESLAEEIVTALARVAADIETAEAELVVYHGVLARAEIELKPVVQCADLRVLYAGPPVLTRSNVIFGEDYSGRHSARTSSEVRCMLPAFRIIAIGHPICMHCATRMADLPHTMKASVGVCLSVQVISVGSVEVGVITECVLESSGTGLPRYDLSVGGTEIGLDEYVVQVGEIQRAEVGE